MADLTNDTLRDLCEFCTRNFHGQCVAHVGGKCECDHTEAYPLRRIPAKPTEATNDDLVIWWISDEDRREMRMVHMPHYLYDEIIDSMGRGARGRLWVAPQFGDVDVSAVFNTGDAITYRAHSAGFVLTRKDAADYEIADLDIGVLTDLAMNELTVESV